MTHKLKSVIVALAVTGLFFFAGVPSGATHEDISMVRRWGMHAKVFCGGTCLDYVKTEFLLPSLSKRIVDEFPHKEQRLLGFRRRGLVIDRVMGQVIQGWYSVQKCLSNWFEIGDKFFSWYVGFKWNRNVVDAERHFISGWHSSPSSGSNCDSVNSGGMPDIFEIALNNDSFTDCYRMHKIPAIRSRYNYMGARRILYEFIGLSRYFDSSPSFIYLPTSEGGIYDNEKNRKPSPKQFLAFVGFIVSIVGFVFLFKIIGKVYSDAVFNEYLAVCGACASFTLAVFGLLILLNQLF
jgi:hypothetical protein